MKKQNNDDEIMKLAREIGIKRYLGKNVCNINKNKRRINELIEENRTLTL